MLCLLFVLIFRFLQSDAAMAPCVHLDFPSLNGTDVLETTENTTVQLEFMIRYTCDPGDFVLHVTKETKPFHKDVCTLYPPEDKCRQTEFKTRKSCTCVTKNKRYRLTLTVNRSDNANWTWSSQNDKVEKKTIEFQVLYPASVSSLVVNSSLHQLHQPADKGQQVDVICSWDEGNPPVTARLLDRHGVEMEGSIYSSGQIRYRFPAVSCQDAGLIRCEAPGASHNKTTTLLVKCPPAFKERYLNFTANTTQTTELSFRFRAHSTASLMCLIIKDVVSLSTDNHGSLGSVTGMRHPLSETRNGSLYNCTGNMFITGTPPDLTLTVRLDNVRKEEEGQWRLELTNDVGTGHVDFNLHVTESKETEIPGVTLELFIAVVSTLGIFAFIASVIAVTCSILRRRLQGVGSGESDEVDREVPADPPMEAPREDADQDDEGSSASNVETNFYWEIPDEPPPSPALPKPCLRPALPDNYLHPSMSTAVKDGSEDTRKMAPFYENSVLRSVGAAVKRTYPTASPTAQEQHVPDKSCDVSQAMASPRMTTVSMLSSLPHNARKPQASSSSTDWEDTVPHGDVLGTDEVTIMPVVDQEDDDTATQPGASHDYIPMSRRLPQTTQIASDYVPMQRKHVGKPHRKVKKPSELRERDKRHTPRASDKASGVIPMSRKAATCLRKEAEKSCGEVHVPLSRMRVKCQPKDEQKVSDSEMSLQREKKTPADDYLTPTVSRAITGGTETVRNDFPNYENSPTL